MVPRVRYVNSKREFGCAISIRRWRRWRRKRRRNIWGKQRARRTRRWINHILFIDMLECIFFSLKCEQIIFQTLKAGLFAHLLYNKNGFWSVERGVFFYSTVHKYEWVYMHTVPMTRLFSLFCYFLLKADACWSRSRESGEGKAASTCLQYSTRLQVEQSLRRREGTSHFELITEKSNNGGARSPFISASPSNDSEEMWRIRLTIRKFSHRGTTASEPLPVTRRGRSSESA